jgi:murein DD-endopeptidase MepM/ murein hydrolase activator NlpD
MKIVLPVLAGLLIAAGVYWAIRAERNEPSLAEAIAAATAPFPAPPVTGSHAEPQHPADATTAAPASATAAPTIGTLLIPVRGITAEQLQDSFTDERAEGHMHDAIDISAPIGTPVLAVADGTVEKLFDSLRGGLTLYQFGAGDQYCYYYAHLQRYADGLTEKQTIHRGQVIGYVGSTGHADAEAGGAPHLHFEIHLLGPERHWWQGQALDPYPLLATAQTAE